MNLTSHTSTEKRIFSVSQLNLRAKQLLECHLPLIWVSGELSNLAVPSSGHWYFTLKDQQAQVRCAMFRGANQRLRWKPASGDQVILRARVSLYEGRGEYQLIAEHMEAAGAGLLQQQYETVKNKLASEGLFDNDRKQVLPTLPRHIGVITSTTGAAIHDILSVLKRRYPVAPVTIFPVSVQGEQAVGEMIQALTRAQQFDQCDVLIMARGGGSIEDLWAFNHEELARVIAHCPIPVVSAVGHEVDFTIADFVADQRAPTPSASAEMVTPDINELLQSLDSYQEKLTKACINQLQQLQQRVTLLRRSLHHPGERLQRQQYRLSSLQHRLLQAFQHKRVQHLHRLTHLSQRLSQQHPGILIQQKSKHLNQAASNLRQAMKICIDNKEQRFLHRVSLLNAINPLAVLSRGYSITRRGKNEMIRNSTQLQPGDEIMTQVSSGKITSVVKSLLHDNE